MPINLSTEATNIRQMGRTPTQNCMWTTPTQINKFKTNLKNYTVNNTVPVQIQIIIKTHENNKL